MKLRFVLFVSILLAGIAVGLALAVYTLPTRDDVARQMAFNERVREYLISHPEVLMEAAQIFERRSSAKRVAQRQRTLAALNKVIRSSRGLPVLGNPEGDVTVVEFFDYRCPYCKRSLDELHRLVADDPNLRLVFKEFPILGPQSVFASRVAIAASEQGKYIEIHEALMSHHGAFDEDSVMAIAREIGLDEARLRADMIKPRVERMIAENRLLADRLAISGTPAMIIGDELLPGFADIVTLKKLVLQARRRCDTC